MIAAFTDCMNNIIAEPVNVDVMVFFGQEWYQVEFKVEHDLEFDLLIFSNCDLLLHALR